MKAKDEQIIKEVKSMANGHKSNWLTILKAYLKTLDDLTKADGAGDLAKIKAVLGVELSKTLGNTYDKAKAIDDLTKALGDGDLAAIKTAVDLITAAGPTKAEMDTGHGLLATEAKQDVIDGYHDVPGQDGEDDAQIRDVVGKKTDTVAGTSLVAINKQVKAKTDNIPAAPATEAKQDTAITHLTDIKGGGWDTQTLVAIKAAIDAINTLATSQIYIEQIPDEDITLAAIDDILTDNPPDTEAANTVVGIAYEANYTHALRSLWVSITNLGSASALTFKLWVYLGGAFVEVDAVDVIETGIQNLMDIFGLQEVHADGIWITVQTAAGESGGALTGVYRCAKAQKAA